MRMLFAVTSELEPAQYIATKHELVGDQYKPLVPPPATFVVVVAPPTCQICLDECNDPSAIVRAFCGRSCPAVVCKPCLKQHVRVCIDAAFVGVLPKVRCPICLVPVNMTKWQTLTSTFDYHELCKQACSFQTPCCHNAEYTHLPITYEDDEYDCYHRPPALKLVPSLQAKIPDLRRRVKRFCNHKMSSTALISYIEDAFGRSTTLETQHVLVEHVLERILDDERRATLLLSYHAKHPAVQTRCCRYGVCFNCKRIANHATRADCDEDEIAADCIVECRSCRVTMVKVEGCDAVRCWCGFDMDWLDELKLRDLNARGLVPIDVYNLELHESWAEFCEQMRVTFAVIRVRALLPRVRRVLRSFLLRVTWKRKLRRLLPSLREYMRVFRKQHVQRRLQLTDHVRPRIAGLVMRRVYRRRHLKCLPELKRELLAAQCAALMRALRRGRFEETLLQSRLLWRVRMNLVNAEIADTAFALDASNASRSQLSEQRMRERNLLTVRSLFADC